MKKRPTKSASFRRFASLLVANRGEIACRVITTARRMGLKTIAVYSEADAGAPHTSLADEAVYIGPPEPRESYLNIGRILDAARACGAEAIHPGYGFLSENAEFAEAVVAAGIVFVGPPAEAIRAMGLKGAAKALMQKAGVPIVPGYHGDAQEIGHLAAEAEKVGYPILIKAVAGGGGKGMRRVDAAKDFKAALESAQREAKAAFGDERVLIERYVQKPRHIEIQVFADTHGNAISLFERDCSLQRRHQKVIEEAPAPGMPEAMRRAMGEAAVKAARAVGYVGAGTVEFICDASEGLKPDRYWFMEMNTRLQVEHRVTELITGQDLVAWQLKVAAGEPLPSFEPTMHGHAIQARLYAEDPAKNFFPSPGTLHRLSLPHPSGELIVDTGVAEGGEVTLHYDPMIAKIVAHATTREAAIARLVAALRAVEIAGVRTNASFLQAALGHSEFGAGAVDTGFIDRHLASLVHDPAPTKEALAAASLRLALVRRPAAGCGPKPMAGAFRAPRRAPGAPFRFEVAGAGKPAKVLLAFRAGYVDADVEGAAFSRVPGGGEGALAIAFTNAPGARRNTRFAFARAGARLYVMTDGATHDLLIASPFEPEETGGKDVRAITAPLAGKIVSVQAKAGQSVKRGQALVVLEAMKMEHTLVAEAEAVIERVDFSAGDQVREGQVIVHFAAA
ncbi:MAG: biotin carboxylase N-terminal domain-containing protein [Alphaproteobacteria bacterium]